MGVVNVLKVLVVGPQLARLEDDHEEGEAGHDSDGKYHPLL